VQKKQGVYAVVAAIAIQLVLGIAYIWSVFQTGVADSIFGGNNAAANLTFSLLLLTMTTGSVIGGKLAVKYTTRRVVFAGGIIASVGFIAASFVTANVAWLLWLSYGIVAGTGMGFTYSTTIACAQKWYPHKKGLITGLIVFGLGFGSVIFAPVLELLISAFGGIGTGETRTFLVLGVISLVVCTIGSIFMKNPPEGYMSDKIATKNSAQLKPVPDRSPREMLKTPQFYLTMGTFLLAVIGGLMMIGFARPIAVARGLESIAALGVVAIAMFNSIGRLIWGMVCDKLGRIHTIIILLLGTAVLSLFVNLAGGYWIFVLLALIGFFYGGLLSTFPALTADLFGAKHMAANYGFVLLGLGVGALISSQLGGYYMNLVDYSADINLMFPAFVIASICAAVGIVMMLILKAMTKRKG